jgi:probable rRNA maturation factor
MMHIEFATKPPKGLSKKALMRGMEAFAKAERLRGDISVGLSFVSPREIRTMNEAYRGKDCETDVLSFPFEEKGFPDALRKETGEYLGDIVICPGYAKTEAKRRGIGAEEELLRLFIHGLLHLRGYDHRDEREEMNMFQLQESLIEEAT